MLRCKLLHENAKVPVQGRNGDAGYDLVYVGPDVWLHNGNKAMLETGVAFEIPYGFYGRIADRSSMASKGLTVLGGVVDSNYRGEVKVILANVVGDTVEIKSGDKIAQIIIEPHRSDEFRSVARLTGTARGEQGFGSSGR